MPYTKKPLFFLFTCVKNGRKYINKLFASLVGQTSKNFIHYIYEDGSDDPIDDLVSGYIKQINQLETGYEVIYEHNKRNVGLNMSTKHCIDKCNLRYFIWIDCDNWVDSHFFEELEKTVLDNPDSIVIRTNKCVVSENGSIIQGFQGKVNNKRNDVSIVIDNYYYSFFAVNTELYHKIDAENFIIDKKDFFNDTQVLFKCSVSPHSFVFAKKALGFMLLRHDSEFNSNISIDYLKKEPLFIQLLSKLAINVDYSIYDVLKVRNLLEEIKQNNISKKYINNLKLIKKKRTILRKNNISYKYGEVYSSDFMTALISLFRGVTRL